MAQCKDCIHEKVCSALIKYGLPWNDEKYPAEKLCFEFLNKADVVPKSEVEEIFEEIEDVLNNIGYFDEIDFKALKKKYTESEDKG